MEYNLLIIVPDQLRADYLSCYGHPFIETHHIDALAAHGTRFDRAYCAAPLCGPSRISFVSSTYVGEHNHRNYASTCDYYKIPNIISVLKQTGYVAGMFGKNHCFHYDQLDEVWDESRLYEFGNYDRHPKSVHSWSSFEMEPDHEFNQTRNMTTDAISFMRTQATTGQPFVTWVNYHDPHPAFTCPEPYYSMFDPAEIDLPPNFRRTPDPTKPQRLHNWHAHSEMALATDDDVRRAIATYCGQIRYVDDQVGRMVSALNELNIADKTVILFFGDHGEFLGDFGVFHKLPVFYECLTRIPAILVHPDWPAQTLTGLIQEIDFVPTVLDSLGLDVPPTMVGRNFAGDLSVGADGGRESILVEAGGGAPTPSKPLDLIHKAPFAPNSFGPAAMVCDGRYKLSHYADDRNELYDLLDDPHELSNRYDDPAYTNIRHRLSELLLDRLLSVKVRDVGRVDWPVPDQRDPRFEPLES